MGRIDKGTPLWKALLFERRLPWRYRSLGNYMGLHFNFAFKKVLRTPILECNPDSEVDYFTIICHKHLNMYILAVKSFLRFYNNVRVVVADDGTLTEKDCRILRKHIKDITIYKRDWLDKTINEKVKSSFLKELRKIYLSELKIIDVNLLCQKRKMLIDSDVLFLKRPDEIIEWCNNSESKPFYTTCLPIESSSEEKDTKTDLEKTFDDDPSTVRNIQYFFRKNLAEINKKLDTNIDVLDYNAGVIGYNERLSMDRIEFIKKTLISFAPKDFKPWGVEQCTHAFLFKEKSQKLNNKYYFTLHHSPPNQVIKEAKMIHFIEKAHIKQYSTLGKKTIDELTRFQEK